MIGPSTPTIAGLLILVGAGAAMAQPAAPSKPPEPPPAVPLILDAPATLDGLLDRLRSPDFVLLRGDRYRDLLKARAGEAGETAPIVESVAIRGRVDRRTAELEAEFRVASTTAGPAWVPLRLDGIVLASALEGGQAIPVRTAANGGWEAEVRGTGPHLLRVAFATRVIANGEERRLDLPIPLAGTNTLRLELGDSASDASLGGSEPLEVVKAPGEAGARISAALKPRGRLDLRWRVPSDPGGSLPPLLGVQGDVAVDVTPDAIRTRSRWSVSSARGTATSLTLLFDAEEELLEVALDGRVLPVEGRTRGPSTAASVPLPEPLRPGAPARSVTLVTRRKIDTRSASRLTIRGGSIDGAASGGGALSVSQSGPIWVEGESARGLQRIDPANDLPSDLRSRPGTILAYRIVGRPFELGLRVEPSPPLVEARASIAVVVRPGASSVETRFDVRATPGRVFDLHFPLSDDVQLEPLPPDDVVESWNVSPSAGRGGRILTVRLTAKSTASGAFAVTLKTRQVWPAGGGEVRNVLTWPSAAASLGGRVSVSRGPGVEVRLAGATAPDVESPPFTRIPAPARGDWPWPAERASDPDPSPLWLAYDGQPDSLPLLVSVRPPSYRSDIDLSAEVGRAGITYREAVRLEVIGGRIDDFELLVPAGVEPGWSIEGIEVSGRSPVESRPDGSSRHRVVLARKGASRVAFELRFATAFGPPNGDGRAGRFTLIRAVPAWEGPIRLAWSVRPGVALSVEAPGWQERIAGASPDLDLPAPGRLYRPDSSGPLPAFTARAEPILALPDLVVSRCFLRTVRGSEELRTTAIFRIDVHGPSAIVTLPETSRWVRARLDGVELREVERVEAPDGYRCHLGQGPGTGPRTLTIDYASPIPADGAWRPPTLVGAVTEATYWEAVLPGNQAILGTPAGWSDENRWRWMGYVWMRTPRRDDPELTEWAAGESSTSAEAVEEARPGRTGQHAYLFRRADGLAALPVAVASRSVLLVACSGAVALVGIGLVLIRPAARPYGALAAALVAMVASAWEPDLALQLIPCGVLGLLLTAVAAALQWAVNRRRAGPAGRFAGAVASASAMPSSSGPAVATVGSDDSTAIRARPPAAPDRFVIAPAVPAEPTPSISEMGLRP